MESKLLNENSIMSVEQSVLEESSELVMFKEEEYLSDRHLFKASEDSRHSMISMQPIKGRITMPIDSDLPK